MAHARWHTMMAHSTCVMAAMAAMAHSDGTGHTQPASGRTHWKGLGVEAIRVIGGACVVWGVYMVHWCMYTRGQGNVGLCLIVFIFNCCYLGGKFGKKLQI